MAFLPGEPIAMEIPLLFFLPAEEAGEGLTRRYGISL